MKGHRLDDDLVRSSFERRARGFPAPRLLERILRATGRAQRGPLLVLVPEPIARPSQVRRFALLAAAPLTVLLLAVLVAGQRSPLLVGASAVGAGTSTSAAIVDDDEGAADEDESEGTADDEADEADEAEDGPDGDETEDDD